MGTSKNTFFVTLYSNAVEGYPDNNPGSFSNLLDHPIDIPRSAGWQVALLSLTCSNHFKSDAFSRVTTLGGKIEQVHLAQISVRCRQLGVNYDSRQLLSCHSLRTFDEYKWRVHNYSPKNLLFFPLFIDQISSLSIELLDGELRPLQFRRTQPTVCVLQFSRVSSMYLPLWIHSQEEALQQTRQELESGGERKNRAANFRVRLPPQFVNSSSSKWEIALSSFTFIPDFHCVPLQMQKNESNNIFHAVDLSQDDNVILNAIQADGLSIPSTDSRRLIGQTNWPPPSDLDYAPIVVKPDMWRTVKTRQGLMHTLQTLFQTFHIFKTNYNPRDVTSGDPMFEIKFIGGRRKRAILVFKVRSILYMPVYVAHMCGWREYATTSDGGLAIFAGDVDSNFVGRRYMDVKALSPHTLSIACDFIEPTFVAGVKSPILKTFAVTQRESDDILSTTHEVSNLEFHPLNQRELTSMHFQIISADGNEVDFTDIYQNIVVGLVLKTA